MGHGDGDDARDTGPSDGLGASEDAGGSKDAGASDDAGASGVSPETAFKILGNETRMQILLALWEAEESAVGFSELYRRTGVGDSGQFNYHLEKLVDHFVTSSDDGYRLTNAGWFMVRAVVAGTATSRPTIEPTEVDADCPACGAPVEIQYANGILSVTCTGCDGFWRDPDHPERTIGQLAFPPAALRDRTPLEVLEAGAIYLVDKAETEMKGVCPLCTGRVESKLELCWDHDETGTVCDVCGNPFIGVFHLTCQTCRTGSRAPSFAAVHHHPVVERLYDRSVHDVADPWAWMWRGIDWPETVLDDESAGFRTVVEHAGERHVFEVDENCDVTHVQ